MQDTINNLRKENRRMNEIIKAVERQRNEALAARAVAEATASMVQENLQAVVKEAHELKARLTELERASADVAEPAVEKPARKTVKA